MNDGQYRSFLPTSDEKWRLATAALEAFVPGSTLFTQLVEYAYRRRDLIYDTLGIPRQAYSAGKVLPLRSLATPGGANTLSINITITDAAQRLGLRQGDPVTVMVAGHDYVSHRSGLVVPARIGQPVDISLPAGDYSLAGLGARRETLLTAPDPYSTMGGGTVQVAGQRWLDLPLTARNTVPPPLGHRQVGLQRVRCRWCSATFVSSWARDAHFRREHGDWWDRTRQRVADFWDDL
jgi:hypothetical protein